MEERIDDACKNVLSRIPEYLYCEDLYQDIACIYLDIYSKHLDHSHAQICNQIYSRYINKLINKYDNDKCDYIILPENTVIDEDGMMFMITDFFGIIKYFLTEKEFDIICKRFIDNKTLESIGQIYGVTREPIRQIENKAIRKLRNPK